MMDDSFPHYRSARTLSTQLAILYISDLVIPGSRKFATLADLQHRTGLTPPTPTPALVTALAMIQTAFADHTLPTTIDSSWLPGVTPSALTYDATTPYTSSVPVYHQRAPLGPHLGPYSPYNHPPAPPAGSQTAHYHNLYGRIPHENSTRRLGHRCGSLRGVGPL